MANPHPSRKPGGRFPRPPGPGGKRAPAPARGDAKPGDTSWEKSAAWYDKLIGEKGSSLYQELVIPGALELLAPAAGEAILDLGCGQGVFTRALAQKKAVPTGVDASASLIRGAREYPGSRGCRFLARDAAELEGLGPFDAVSAILSLQNMRHLTRVAAASAAVTKPGGRHLWVMNHPCFRIPRQTAWGFDEQRKIQFRRVDAYSSPMEIPIVMHPGRKDSEQTVSFHHSLQELLAAGFSAGMRLRDCREWHSPRVSQPGPRARAENRARAEFPLFIALLWEKA
jgi:ubiquinone/menaquinone biosynthesis C-methylase UbiE